MRELRKLLERIVKLALTELLRSGGDMGHLFEKTCGIRVNVKAAGSSLAAQFFLNLGLDIDNDSHQRGLSPIGLSTAHDLGRDSR
jgi:hypothetical protein